MCNFFAFRRLEWSVCFVVTFLAVTFAQAFNPPKLLWSAHYAGVYETYNNEKSMVATHGFGGVSLWNLKTKSHIVDIDFDGALQSKTQALVPVEFVPLKNLLAVSTKKGPTRFISTIDGTVQFSLPTRRVSSIAFNHVGSKAVTNYSDGTVEVWDMATKSVISVLRTGTQGLGVKYEFLANDSTVVGIGDGKFSGSWNIYTGMENFYADKSWGIKLDSLIAPISFAIDTQSSEILIQYKDTSVFKVWELKEQPSSREFNAHTAKVFTVEYNGKFTQLVSASKDSTAIIWDAKTSKALHILKHTSVVTSASFNSDGSKVITANADGEAIVWDVSTGKETQRFSLNNYTLNSAVFVSEGEVALSGCDGFLTVFNTQTIKEVYKVFGFQNSIFDCKISEDSKYLVAKSHDQNLVAIDLNKDSVILNVMGIVSSRKYSKEFGFNWVSFSLSSNNKLAWVKGGTCIVYDLDNRTIVENFTYTHPYYYEVAINRTGDTIALTVNDGIAFRKVGSQRFHATYFKEYTDGNPRLLRSSSTDGIFAFNTDLNGWKFVDSKTGSIRDIFRSPTNESFHLVKFSKDKDMALAFNNRFVTVMSWKTRNRLIIDNKVQEIFIYANFHPTLPQIYTLSSSGAIKFWSISTGALLDSINAYTSGYMINAGFNATSTYYFENASDSIKLWNNETKTLISSFCSTEWGLGSFQEPVFDNETNEIYTTSYTIRKWQFNDIALSAAEEFTPTRSISIYPNPTEDILHVQLCGEIVGMLKISIVNMVGEIVYETYTTNSTNEINTTSLPPGAYAIHSQGKSTLFIKQ